MSGVSRTRLPASCLLQLGVTLCMSALNRCRDEKGKKKTQKRPETGKRKYGWNCSFGSSANRNFGAKADPNWYLLLTGMKMKHLHSSCCWPRCKSLRLTTGLGEFLRRGFFTTETCTATKQKPNVPQQNHKHVRGRCTYL